MLASGGLPYVDFVEKKPLLAYVFYAPAGLFGWHLWPTQLLAVAWIAATATLIGRTATLVHGPRVGHVAAAICALVSAANVQSVNTEIMLNLPVAAALYFHVRRRSFLCGLCIAAATLFKHQAGIVLVALTLSAILDDQPFQLRRHALVAAGFALPWVAAAGLYAALHHLPEFLEWNLTRNLAYSSLSVGSRGARFAASFALIVVAGSGFVWWHALAGLRRDDSRAFAVTLVLTWIPVCLGGRFYEHYFLQLAPPLALVAAPSVARAWVEPSTRRRTAALLAAPAVAFSLLALAWGVLHRFPSQEPRARAVAAWLRSHSAAGDRVFVWGHFTPIYYFAERLPGTRYYNASNHMGDFDPHHLPPGFDVTPNASARDVAQTLADLERNRPAYVVDTAPAGIHEWNKVPLAAFPALDRYLSGHYALVARPGGASVYRRR